jgi:type II secretory pathway component PulF
MLRKNFFIISSIVSGTMLAGLFILQAIMPGMARQWIDQGVELSATQRMLFAVAMFWSRFWWLAWPFVIATAFAIVGLIATLRHVMVSSKRV